ncbi:MAG TPA: hypothetical protein VGJ26_15080 [Pirellulales bacterium]
MKIGETWRRSRAEQLGLGCLKAIAHRAATSYYGAWRRFCRGVVEPVAGELQSPVAGV